MKIGIAQINTIIGDLSGNKEKILAAYTELCKKGADLVLFPELTICGYPPRDLIFKSKFVSDTETTLKEIAAAIHSVPAIIGFVEANKASTKRSFFNAIAWCENGGVQYIGHKCLLPSYGVFEEERYFTPGKEPLVVNWKNRRIGITICEDIWTSEFVNIHRTTTADPIGYLEKQNIDLLLNLSASPWEYNKVHTRIELVSSNVSRCRCPLVYCNQIGGNDELIFDGRSFVMHADGSILFQLPAFQESLQVIDIREKIPSIISLPTQTTIAEIHDALILGLRDYAQKCGFSKALLGLSGGIDSAVVAYLGAQALGHSNILGVSLPSDFSSASGEKDASSLAQNLKIDYQCLKIQSIVNAANTTLTPIFGNTNLNTAEENIQARTRGLLLMAISNKFNTLLLSTGNKSELAVGYCTLYGDMAGGLSVIGDLTKTKVYELAQYINREKNIIPENSITRPPSPELRPNQFTQDDLPPYSVIDPIITHYIEDAWDAKKIIEKGSDPAIVYDIIRRIDRNEYKRKQAAPVLKISPLAFGAGRRIPIAQKYIS